MREFCSRRDSECSGRLEPVPDAKHQAPAAYVKPGDQGQFLKILVRHRPVSSVVGTSLIYEQ
jgi:hypothetical protein